MTTTFVNDTFTDTNGVALTAHTGETGATWTLAAGFTAPGPAIYSNRIRSGKSAGQCVFTSGVANADGEYAEAVVETVTAADSFGVFIRGNAAGCRGYMAFFSGGLCKVMRLDNSFTFTQIGSNASQSVSTGAHTVRVTATGTGASVGIVVKYDGTDILSVSDTGGSRITALGSVGVYFDTTNSDTAGSHIGSITGVDPSTPATMSFTTPVDGTVRQLSGGATGTATVAATGTYTGTAPDQIRLVDDGTSTAVSGFDWATIGSATGGNWSHTFSSVTKGGWYNVQIRNSGTPGTIYTSGKVGAGVLVQVDGQSWAWLFFSPTAWAGDSSLTANAKLRINGKQPTAWDVPATTTMNAAIACGNALVTALSCPVGLIDGAWDGSGLTVTTNGGRWISGGAAGNAYTDSAATLTAAGGDCAATIWIQGQADAGSSVSQSTYYTALGQMIALRRTDVGDAAHPYVMVTFPRYTAGLTDAQVEAIRKAHVQACSDTGIYRVDSPDIPLHSDGIHPTAAGFTTLGQRCAQAVLHALGVASSSRGPSIASVAQVSSTAFDVNLTLRGSATDFTPTSSITGFRALVSGSPVTISSVSRQSATKVRITLSSTPASMPTVDYLYGAAPTITGVVKDNSSLTLPLEYNSGVLAVAAATAVTLTLTTDGTTPAASLTGLKWAFFDQVTPNLFAAPVAQGAVESTDGSGGLVLDITGSALAPGAVGWLVITNSDGTTTQSPAHKLFAGPVTVS